MASSELHLVKATREHLLQMLGWFSSHEAVTNWGGYEFRFPFTEETFLTDSKWQSIPSYALLDESGTLYGFGQRYLRVGRCHLGRLAVAPQFRGQGIGARFVELMMKEGKAELGVNEGSLFVSPTNPRVIPFYERLGFRKEKYPVDDPAVAIYQYMVIRPAA